jgi:hypothetical protein
MMLLPVCLPADSMAWDMNDMGGVMFVPVVFCLHMVLICLGTFSGTTAQRLQYNKMNWCFDAALPPHSVPALWQRVCTC